MATYDRIRMHYVELVQRGCVKIVHVYIVGMLRSRSVWTTVHIFIRCETPRMQ